jgi:uncharacterized protein (DUF58 family)
VAALNLAVHRSMASTEELIERFSTAVRRTAATISSALEQQDAHPGRLHNGNDHEFESQTASNGRRDATRRVPIARAASDPRRAHVTRT